LLLQLHNLRILRNEDLQRRFEIAVRKGNVVQIRQFAQQGADTTTPDQNGATPVYAAALNGHVDAIRALVELGADVSTPMVDGATPVYAAASNGHVDAIRALVELGADVSTPMVDGATPVYAAAENGHVDAIRVLVQLGANVRTPVVDVITPVHLTAHSGHHVDAIGVLAELGADVSTPVVDGPSPVHAAALHGHAGVIKVLYKLGADMAFPYDASLPSITALAQEGGHTAALLAIQRALRVLGEQAPCQRCGSTSRRRKVCTGCGRARYCSVQCQRRDRRKHRAECSLSIGNDDDSTST
jgi:cytohesin